MDEQPVKPMQWSPVWNNCNAQFWTTPTEFVRCTGVGNHDGLHRCHFEGQSPQHQLAVWMWGNDRNDVSLDSLVGSDPLRLVVADKSKENYGSR